MRHELIPKACCPCDQQQVDQAILVQTLILPGHSFVIVIREQEITLIMSPT